MMKSSKSGSCANAAHILAVAARSAVRADLVLSEDDCLLCGHPVKLIRLGGAYSGSFPTYTLPVQLSALGFDRDLCAVGVPSVPAGFDGIACFSFLNRFTYGNFGDPSQFGLEC
jgi:hypothetical protein